MPAIINGWNILYGGTTDVLPEPGERVLICIGGVMVGEGWLGNDGQWYRYCDLGPVDKYMNEKVMAWRKMPKPPKKMEV